MTLSPVSVPFSVVAPGLCLRCHMFSLLKDHTDQFRKSEPRPRGRASFNSRAPKMPCGQGYSARPSRFLGGRDVIGQRKAECFEVTVSPGSYRKARLHVIAPPSRRAPPARPLPAQSVPADITMSEAHRAAHGADRAAPGRSPLQVQPLHNVINCASPPTPTAPLFKVGSKGGSENHKPLLIERPPLQELCVTSCPPGLSHPNSPYGSRPLPTATWHRMGLSTTAYLFLLKKANPHTTHVMSRLNPDRPFVHGVFLSPPQRYNSHKVSTYNRRLYKWDENGCTSVSSPVHHRRFVSFPMHIFQSDLIPLNSGEWRSGGKTWVPCSQREPLCIEWRNARCETCTHSNLSLHRRTLIHWAVTCENRRQLETKLREEQLEMDPMYCDGEAMDVGPSIADELLVAGDSATEPMLDMDDLVCPPTPRPSLLDDFDDENNDEGDFAHA